MVHYGDLKQVEDPLNYLLENSVCEGILDFEDWGKLVVTTVDDHGAIFAPRQELEQ